MSVAGATTSLQVAGPATLDKTSLYATGGALLSLPGLTSYAKPDCWGDFEWRAEWDSVIALPNLTNITSSGCNVLRLRAWRGGQVLLTNVFHRSGNVHAHASAGGSRLVLGSLRSLVNLSGSFGARVEGGGQIDLARLEAISGQACSFAADGAGSVIDLSTLSSFATPLGASELAARNGGVILLPDRVFLLQNVAVNIPPGNPVLPPTVSAGPALSLYGEAWHSYWVDVRDTRPPASDWSLFLRVPLTNDLQVISGPPKAWQAFGVWEFVADPPILDLHRVGGTDAQLVLYGAPPRSFEVQTTDSLDALPAAWTALDATGPLTNSFRLFPPFPAAEAQRFYRAKEL